MHPRHRQRRHGAAVAVVALVALLAPASSHAATTLGQVNPVTPNGGGNCQPQETYTVRKSDASINSTAPFSGIITSWSTKATDTAGQQAQLKTISEVGNPGAVTYTIQNSTALESLTPSSLNTFSTRIPIQAGQRIGYFFPSGAANSQSCYYFNPSNSDEMAAGPNNGQPGSTFTDLDGSSNRLVNLSAKLEADADGDGFGDETQDRCPGTAGTNGGCAPGQSGGANDKTKPSLTGLSFSATTFRAAKSGSAFSSRKKRAPIGTKVSFRLSEASSVKFTVQRKGRGRKVSGKCKKPTRLNRRKKSCTRWKSVRGSFTVSGKAGKNTFTFRGRIGGKSLSRGSYRLSGRATDPAKNASVPKRKGFRIVR